MTSTEEVKPHFCGSARLCLTFTVLPVPLPLSVLNAAGAIAGAGGHPADWRVRGPKIHILHRHIRSDRLVIITMVDLDAPLLYGCDQLRPSQSPPA
jgi:hypothetical protein